MTSRADTGWQYALADLSLILFMVCALALAQAPKVTPRKAPAGAPVAELARPRSVALGEPAAVWRAGPGMPSLDDWIAGQTADPRQRLTIVARYTSGRAAAAFARADAALQGVRKLPATARIVVEPGASDDLGAMLTWDLGNG